MTEPMDDPLKGEDVSADGVPGAPGGEVVPPVSEAVPAAPSAGIESWQRAGEAVPPATEPSPPVAEPVPAGESVPPGGAPAPVEWAVPGATSAATGTPGRVVPEEGPRRGALRGCVIVAAVVAVLALLGLLALIFLGSQVQNALKGTVEFGTGGTGCGVEARAGSFPAGTDLHFVAWLDRDVSAGETVTLVQSYPDGTSDPKQQVVDAPASCMFGDVVSGPPTGHYTFEVRVGSESLAKGGFDVTP